MSSVLDLWLFAILPYAALGICILATWVRYRSRAFTVSSLSSQWLENRYHFWGSVPFHVGILVVLTGHLLGFLIPRGLLLWNNQPLRLYVLECTGFAFALATLIGIINLGIRRLVTPAMRKVTSLADWLLLGLLLWQIISGVLIALLYPWGSSWFAAVLAPYLWSLVQFQPDFGGLATIPWLVKTHIAGLFLLTAVLPYTRLIHLLALPLPYLWRKPQVVRWYRRGGASSGV